MFDKSQFKFIDLTHPLSCQIPSWDAGCGFCMTYEKSGIFTTQKLAMPAGIGTHMDAPSHCSSGKSMTDFSLDELLLPVCLMDLSSKAHASYTLSIEDVEEHERVFGQIPSGSFVMVHTGWDRFWSDPTAYRNQDETGQRHFPALSKEAASFLVEKGVAGIGIDTLSPDCLDLSYPVHRILLGAGKFIVENVANLSFFPPRGGHVFVVPLPILEAAEAPIRLIGIVRR